MIRVIIVSYNTKDVLKKCLQCIHESTIADQLIITVVDNASRDGSVSMVSECFPTVEVIAMQENLGFGRANNQVLETLTEPYALLLNSDAFVERDTVEKLYNHMETYGDAGLCGPKVLNFDGSIQFSCRAFPSLMQSFMHALLGKISPRNRYSRAYKMVGFDHDRMSDVDWVSGLCMLIRRQALQVVGAFDPQYFFYIEDVDLCKRMHESGWRVMYVPQAQVTHLMNASGGYQSPRMIRAHHESMWIYYRKECRKTRKLVWLPFVWSGIQLRMYALLMKNHWLHHSSKKAR